VGQLESGPVTTDLTTTVVHSSELLINDVKPDHSLTLRMYITMQTSDTEYDLYSKNIILVIFFII